jgi:hypothetical protein
MTLKQVLGLLDHEVWIRVRPHGPIRDKPDIVMWSGDWIGASGYPDEVEKYLECEADDLSAELHPDPEAPDDGSVAIVPMLVVYANTFVKPDPVKVFVLEKSSDYGTGVKHYECRVFLNKERAKAALRDQYDSEIDARDVRPSKKSRLKDTDAWLEFANGVIIEWKLRELLTEDGEYR